MAPFTVTKELVSLGLALATVVGGIQRIDAGVFVAVGGPWVLVLFGSYRFAQVTAQY